jgi:hypothetical protein
VRTIEVAVYPLGGDNFKLRLGAAKSSVGEAKAEIARVQRTEEARQELYKVWRCEQTEDGGAVREDDAEAVPLDEDGMILGDGEVVVVVRGGGGGGQGRAKLSSIPLLPHHEIKVLKRRWGQQKGVISTRLTESFRLVKVLLDRITNRKSFGSHRPAEMRNRDPNALRSSVFSF